jgi:hypothetical protein
MTTPYIYTTTVQTIMSNITPSHLQFDADARPEIIHAKESWQQNPNLYRLDNPNLQDITHGCIKSGSAWSLMHMQAFHIVPILNLETKDVLPQDFLPDDNELATSFHLFWSMNRDDIYDKKWEKFYNTDQTTEANIRAAITSSLNDLMTLVERRKSTDSDLSSTSDEGDKIEFETQAFARSTCRAFLDIMKLHKKDRPSWDYVDSSAKSAHRQILILDSIYGNARNDGAIIHIDTNKPVSSHVWIEVKPLEYAPKPRTENAYINKIPQKAAEALSFAQSHWQQAGTTIQDQESFGIEFNHRYASFWHALFPRQYLLDVHRFPILNHTHAIALKRSKVFDLVESNDRKEFARSLMGLLKYLSQGNPKIGIY